MTSRVRTCCVTLLASLIVAMTAGCSDAEPVTQVVVVISTESMVRGAGRSLEVEIWGAPATGGEFEPRETRAFPPPGESLSWPLEISLVPLGGDATRRYEVVATAFDGNGDPLARVRAISSYRRGEILELPMVFRDSCVGASQFLCGAQLTCVSGECVSAVIDPESLDAFVPGNDEPPIDGPEVLYEFDEGAGSLVHDTSGHAPALDLTIANPGNVEWTDSGLRIVAPTVLDSPSATRVATACISTNELTVDAWITPGSTTLTGEGPGRIVMMSASSLSANFGLGQGHHDTGIPTSVYSGRVRTTTKDDDGLPGLSTSESSVKLALTHVVFTRSSDGLERIYVDGAIAAAATFGGDLSTWAAYALHIGNESGAERPWLGELHRIAIYCRALSTEEVAEEFASGL
jgi:hypothetical protein